MKLEVGMYVRTKNKTLMPPQVAKIINITKDNGYKNQYYIEIDKNLIPSYEFHIYQEDIVKASYNMIDILEKGDYVNSLIVTKISEDNETKKKYINLYGSLCEWENEDIKSVITKEQMEQISYRIEE